MITREICDDCKDYVDAVEECGCCGERRCVICVINDTPCCAESDMDALWIESMAARLESLKQ
jgi:hypothetical protein